jgi:hypothetical protein
LQPLYSQAKSSWIADWIDPRTSLDAVMVKRKAPLLVRNGSLVVKSKASYFTDLAILIPLRDEFSNVLIFVLVLTEQK